MEQPQEIVKCSFCSAIVEPERVQYLNSRICSVCAKHRPEPLRHDPNEVCAQASLGGQNGFSPKS